MKDKENYKKELPVKQLNLWLLIKNREELSGI